MDFNGHYTVKDWGKGIAFYVIGHPATVAECQGHPDDGEFYGPIGETFYCDGSCEVPEPDKDRVIAVMVGDDREHIVDVDDLVPLSEDAFCPGCGQVGCGHG